MSCGFQSFLVVGLLMYVSDGIVNLPLPLLFYEVSSCAHHCPVRVKRGVCSLGKVRLSLSLSLSLSLLVVR